MDLLAPPSPMPDHPTPWMTVREDVDAAMRRDPAATSRLVVLLTFLTLIRRSYGQTATSRPWAAMAQITKTSRVMMSSDQNG